MKINLPPVILLRSVVTGNRFIIETRCKSDENARLCVRSKLQAEFAKPASFFQILAKSRFAAIEARLDFITSGSQNTKLSAFKARHLVEASEQEEEKKAHRHRIFYADWRVI
jgi:hypothetical protein